VSPAKTAVAIEMSFASMILVGPGKETPVAYSGPLWIGRILYCVYSTQYSLLGYH